MSDDNSTSIGADAWGGKQVSAEPKKADISLSSDMAPLSGKSVTSVPEEHRFDRVPPPAKNTNPKPEVPVDGYYEKYKEMMERRRAVDGKTEEQTEKSEPRSSIEPDYSRLTSTTPEAPQSSGWPEADREKVLTQVKSGTPAAFFDATVIPLMEKGLVTLAFRPASEGILDIVAMSTKDNQPLRTVGFARAV